MSPARTRPDRDDDLRQLLLGLAPAEGIHPLPWPGLQVMRVHAPTRRAPVVYTPCLCLAAQGSKRLFLAGDSLVYDAGHYLVMAVPLPLEAAIVEASPERPYLALRLALEGPELSDLVLALDGEGVDVEEPDRRGVYTAPLGDELGDAACRLLRSVGDPVEQRVLAPLCVREILYRLLIGPHGAVLRGVALRDSRAHRMAGVLRWLQRHYAEPLDIASIAEVAHMSQSALHHHFKAVTSVSPLQYLKQLRLHQARLLMLNEGLTAGEAGFRVGYGSPSQFSREFKRLFGAPPSQEVERVRAETGAAWPTA